MVFLFGVLVGPLRVSDLVDWIRCWVVLFKSRACGPIISALYGSLVLDVYIMV